MLLERGADHDNDVEIHEYVGLHFGAQNVVEEALKRGRSGVQSERHDRKLVEPPTENGKSGEKMFR